ncbi:MAG: NAD(P)/FAD-dependent oxidoreductase [Motilibacteraceae bacterium]
MSSYDPLPVVVVGAGMSGVACARALDAAGLNVVVRDRGKRIGGRMAIRTTQERPVDVGAAYFTVRSDEFGAVVRDWEQRGLARPWTDTFHVAGPDGIEGTSSGPVRWAARGGLRSLVEDLAEGLAVERFHDVAEVDAGPVVDGEPARAVVLAMPDPQAVDLLSDELSEERSLLYDAAWEPALSLYAGWSERCWPEIDGVFVNGSDSLSWIADDGRRRGDGAPVLVAHSSPQLAALHLDDPDGARDALIAAVRRVLGIDRDPEWAVVKRWGLARPSQPREESFHLGDSLVGLCGDGWCAPSRIEAAFLSGSRLGAALAGRLG